MKRGSENHTVESTPRGIPLFKCRDLERDTLRLGNPGHPGIGLDRKEIDASFDELHRGDTSAGARLENTANARREHILDQLVGVAGAIRVVVVCRASK